MTIYNILPFPTDGGQVPALHHLSPMRSNGSIVESDKLAIILNKYPKWGKYIQQINNNGLLSRAWAFLKQQTSGVIQNNGRIFQPCVFATAPFALNVVNILKVVNIGKESWGEVRCMDVHNDLPPISQKIWLMQYGLMNCYTAEGMLKIDKDGRAINPAQTVNGTMVSLYLAPKDKGEVYVPILSDGTPLYVNMKWLTLPA